ncbi:hypothetical protein EYC08_16705 [Tabrizicola sp. WMC-M-20]|nr:hypothetical protein EYC08_16705 [Tabrizicola sp. WMC-M-20]
MSNSSEREADISRLHPAIRDKVAQIREKLQAENIPFEVFEAFRTPERQAVLRAKRPKVTWVGPWGSMHQYGLAVDFVLKIDNRWSWNDIGANARHWDRLHELAKENGMTPLFNSKGQLIEKPHIQLAGASTLDLRNGRYPEGGDAIWAERLGDLIDNWSGPETSPPKPTLAPERPPLDPALIAELETESAADAHATLLDPSAEARFQTLHNFIKRWEGGFSNHPADRGGPTNMGITIGTLADWRGKDVSLEDVRNLTRAESDAILRTRYYAHNRCGEMPDRVAMVVYNCAVLSGTKRAVTLIQEAFNSLGLTVDGKKLETDGVMGRLTMGAIQATDSAALATAFMDRQEAHLRSLDTFGTFGTGWINRMAALREFVNTLPQGAGVSPKTTMKISDTSHDSQNIINILRASGSPGPEPLVDEIVALLLRNGGEKGESVANAISLVRTLKGKRSLDPLTVTELPDGKVPLTPINSALGETVGNALNGKKSVSGIVGLVLTMLLPKIGVSGQAVQFLVDNQDILVTAFSLLTGWGLFGKLDKAIRLMGTINK